MKSIEIIDIGRGPQLSTSRVTVQDLVPYLQQKYTHEQILQIMPILTKASIKFELMGWTNDGRDRSPLDLAWFGLIWPDLG